VGLKCTVAREVMSALRPKGFVSYEWEVDWCLCCGLVSSVVNVVDHI
jgi:hypothetical protein